MYKRQSQGDLIEFFDDVDIIDAMLGVAQPTNCHGKKSVKINLDKVMTLPSLDVTVNFTGSKKPKAGDTLNVVVIYTKISELDLDNYDGPDFFVEVPLTCLLYTSQDGKDTRSLQQERNNLMAVC